MSVRKAKKYVGLALGLTLAAQTLLGGTALASIPKSEPPIKPDPQALTEELSDTERFMQDRALRDDAFEQASKAMRQQRVEAMQEYIDKELGKEGYDKQAAEEARYPVYTIAINPGIQNPHSDPEVRKVFGLVAPAGEKVPDSSGLQRALNSGKPFNLTFAGITEEGAQPIRTDQVSLMPDGHNGVSLSFKGMTDDQYAEALKKGVIVLQRNDPRAVVKARQTPAPK